MKHQYIDVDNRYISQVFKSPYTVQIVAGNAAEYPEGGYGNAENSDQIDKYFVAADLAGGNFRECHHTDDASVGEKGKAHREQEEYNGFNAAGGHGANGHKEQLRWRQAPLMPNTPVSRDL